MRGEPVPVFRQQRHFSRDHAKLGTTAALGRLDRRSHGVTRRNGFLATALLPHGITWLAQELQVVSLDHAVWFHQPLRVDELLLRRLRAGDRQQGDARPVKRCKRAA